MAPRLSPADSMSAVTPEDLNDDSRSLRTGRLTFHRGVLLRWRPECQRIWPRLQRTARNYLSALHEPFGRRGPNSLQPGFQFHDGRNHHRDPLELFCRSSQTMSDALILRVRIQQVLAVLA